MAVLHVKSPNGNTDEAMLLANNQTVTGLKTFNDRIAFSPVGQIGIHYHGTESELEEPINLREIIISSHDIDYYSSANGASVALQYCDTTGTNTAENGKFYIMASTGIVYAELVGNQTGELTWCGHRIDVPTKYFISNDSGHENAIHGYIRWGYGLQICWGFQRQTGANGRVGVVNFPLPFIENPAILGSVEEDDGYNYAFICRSVSATEFTFLCNDRDGGAHNHIAHWLAIGRWR